MYVQPSRVQTYPSRHECVLLFSHNIFPVKPWKILQSDKAKSCLVLKYLITLFQMQRLFSVDWYEMLYDVGKILGGGGRLWPYWKLCFQNLLENLRNVTRCCSQNNYSSGFDSNRYFRIRVRSITTMVTCSIWNVSLYVCMIQKWSSSKMTNKLCCKVYR
jgi:hypothetical protein